MKRNIIMLVSVILIGAFVSCEKDDEILQKQEKVKVKQNEANLKSTKSYLSFNRTRTIDYILEHTVYGIDEYGVHTSEAWTTTNYNTDYKVWDVYNDCANLISQGLKAGGVNETSGWWYNDGKSKVEDHSCSASWKVADTQYDWLTGSFYTSSMTIQANQISSSLSTFRGSTTFEALENTLIVGDLIYFDHDDDGDFEHVMMVTKTENWHEGQSDEDYRVYLSGHSANQLNNRMSDVIWGTKEENPDLRTLSISF